MFVPQVPQMMIDDRFLLSYQVGGGGGGSVYRAFDVKTQQHVAIKLLHPSNDSAANQESFLMEAQCLAKLAHPGIVSYVAHGQTSSGSLYLALAWLDGEVLADRLASGPLPITDCMVLARHWTEALAVVHENGIIHRDLKPSNLLLPGGCLDKVTILDFGLACEVAGTQNRTRTRSEVVGTAAYVAPELIRGQVEVSPAADVFSFGCVLYECMAGAPPFAGNSITAILSKILFERVPPLRELRPDVPAALDALVMRMLARDPRERPADGVALRQELTLLSALHSWASTSSTQSVLTSGEERLLTLIVVAPVAQGIAKDDADLAEAAGAGRLAAIHAALAGLGAQIEQRDDGAVIVAFSGTHGAAALDGVERALRSALLLKSQWPSCGIAVATGRGQFPQRMPMGEVVERAARLAANQYSAAATDTEGRQHVLIDEPTQQLIGARLELRPIGEGVFAVHGESDVVDDSRLLLGQPTPCVGRESELRLLEDTLRTCVNRRVARAVIVTGPAGAGKSRLRHEFARRARILGHNVMPLLLRGDQMRTGSPFAVVGQALCRLFGITESDGAQKNRRKLLAYVADCGLGPETARVAEMLGELCGMRFSQEQSPRLLTARHDPRVMMAQVSHAWVDLLTGLCARRPVLLILEDLHYADALSVALVGAALREMTELPLLVLAMGRPETDEIYPQLWNDREPQRVRLGNLSRKACERLARHVLGATIGGELLARLAEQSGGNALCLEELIRVAAEQKRSDLPSTVLLVLQARLLRLPPEQRRTLRAASLFGEVFWRGGVLAMLGSEYRTTALDETLALLVEHELIERQPDSRIANEQEFRFRHCLIRDAALSLLTASDRTLGHRIAASYLEQVEEPDPMVLAEHFRNGEQLSRALPYFLATAEQALIGSDLEGALARVEDALACQPSGEPLGTLRGIALAAHFWRDEWAQAIAAGPQALRLLPPGSTAWCRAAAIMLPISMLTGSGDAYAEIAATLLTFEPSDEACRAYLQASSYVVIMASLAGQSDMAAAFEQRVQKYRPILSVEDQWIVGNILFSQTVKARMLGRDPWQSYQLSTEGVRACETAGDMRTQLFLMAFQAIGLAELGDLPGAERILDAAEALATRLREPLLLTHVRVHIEQVQLTRGEPAGVEAAYDSARQSLNSVGVNPLLRGQTMINMARAQLRRGDVAGAETTARSAALLLASTPAHLNFLAPVLIDCLLQQGRVAEAKVEADAGLQRIRQVGSGGYAEVAFLHAAALAVQAAGDRSAADEILAEARAQLQRRASCIPDPSARERYLSDVEENRRVVGATLS